MPAGNHGSCTQHKKTKTSLRVRLIQKFVSLIKQFCVFSPEVLHLAHLKNRKLPNTCHFVYNPQDLLKACYMERTGHCGKLKSSQSDVSLRLFSVCLCSCSGPPRDLFPCRSSQDTTCKATVFILISVIMSPDVFS